MTRVPWTRSTLAAIVFLFASGCSDLTISSRSPREAVRERIDALAPAANIGHRGAGVSGPDNPFPENSLPSFREAIAQGADGIELDVELTADGELVVMHDDTLDRTTTCTGCVSAYTLAETQECQLLDGNGQPTDQVPPTLPESYGAVPPDAIVNVELKAYGSACRTPTTGPTELARVAVAQVRDLGVADRTVFSSFNDEAAATVREEGELYSALLLDVTTSTTTGWPAGLARAREIGQDAIHPFFIIPPDGVRTALDAGLQVNVWTVNRSEDMRAAIEAEVTAIITDEPAILAEVLGR